MEPSGGVLRDLHGSYEKEGRHVTKEKMTNVE